jgi:hypothetical protein
VDRVGRIHTLKKGTVYITARGKANIGPRVVLRIRIKVK